MHGPKIAVIGSGSYFFGKAVIHKMASSGALAGGTLALVDTDEKVLRTTVRLAKRVLDAARRGVKVVGSTDRRKVLAGSDFVVLTFSYRNAYYRGVDTQIAARHGIRMCSSDTIGPGGVFRALREVPVALAVASDAARLAPGAWVINFVNPTAVLGMALRRYAPHVRSFAICDGHHEPYHTLRWCKEAGILPPEATAVPPEVQARLDLRIGGVNHFTWMTRFTYAGKDMMPAVRRRLLEQVQREKSAPGEHSKARYNATYAMELWDLYGVYPTNIGHTKEYVPFFQGYGRRPVRPEPVALFDAEQRQREMERAWGVTREYADGRRSVKEFMAAVRDDHASDIIESMWGGLGKPFYISSPNRGAATSLPEDAFLELRCDVDMNGPRPQPFGAFPRGVLALQHQILDTHELTAEAAVTGDRATLRRAMLTDPLCNNIPDADACIADLLAAQKDVLPAYWYGRKRR